MMWKRRTVTVCALALALVAGPLTRAAAEERDTRTMATLFRESGTRGERRPFTSEEPDLGRIGWRDRAASVRLEGGSWELCRERDYRECTVFAPGSFDLGTTRLERHLRSLRPFGRAVAEDAYTRAEARFILDRLYRGLLGRNVDAPSVDAAVQEIRSGRLRVQCDALVRSQEFRSGVAELSAEDQLERIYEGLLERGVDERGARTYLARIQKRQYTDVVLAIVSSSEFRKQMPR